MQTGSLRSQSLRSDSTTRLFGEREQSNFASEESTRTLDSVREYYGKVLKTKNDLKTTACCSTDIYTPEMKQILELIHPEVIERSYGCGIPIPALLEGCTVLDMGSGAGRDAFILSKLVGASGKVIGVDMTPEQVAVAREHQDYHARAFGLERSNISFEQGYMEDLRAVGLEDDSVDVVISNCVFNLSPSKSTLFAEVFRVLKPGGELYFSDVFVDRRLPDDLQHDPVLLGECLGGAMYFEDFRRTLQSLGIADFRIVSRSPIGITDESIKNKVGHAQFSSITIRAFKLQLEDRCEDYGQAAFYKGTIPGCPHSFELDDHHVFETGRSMSICSNSAAMIRDSRFGKHFQIVGDGQIHYGLFPCGPTADDNSSALSFSGCC